MLEEGRGSGRQTLLRMSGWRGNSVDLVAELLELAAGGADVAELQNFDTRGAGVAELSDSATVGAIIGELRDSDTDGAVVAVPARRLRLCLDWWGQLTAIQIRYGTGTDICRNHHYAGLRN